MERAATIFALATARGRAGIAVVRISGPDALQALAQLAGDVPPARHAARRQLKDAQGVALDDALVIAFAGPKSYTGDDCAELHLHGGLAVVQAVVAALAAIPGLRPAEAGEFTRRAVEAGRMDLTAAEAVADLVNAETDGQRRQALNQLAGGLGQLYEGWRADLIRLRALVEAEIDFVDEDLGLDLPRRAAPLLADLRQQLAAHLSDNGRGERLRQGVSVAVVGAPNVGKSSLLNRLVGREAAIVSSRAGTTRDVIEVHLDLGGVPVILADTAGLRDSDDPIEAEGIERARARAKSADLVLEVIIPGQTLSGDLGHGDRPHLVVINKCDLGTEVQGSYLSVSALTGEGMDALIAELTRRAGLLAGLSEAPVLTRARHRAHLVRAQEALARVSFTDPELTAEDLRIAADALGAITGRVDIEDVLDVVFAEFCIGK
jgi:tRNA modification GTPase